MNRTQVMRDYVNGQIPGQQSVIDTFSTAQLEAMIDNSYAGGLDAWSVDYTGRPARTLEETQIRLRARYTALTGGRLTPHQTVISIQTDDAGRVLVGIETLSVREGVTRETVTGRTLSLFVYDGSNLLQRIDARDPEFSGETTVGQYTPVNTPERFSERMSQWLTCYRPGSDSNPLDGCYGPTRKDALLAERAKFRELQKEWSV